MNSIVRKLVACSFGLGLSVSAVAATTVHQPVAAKSAHGQAITVAAVTANTSGRATQHIYEE